MSRFKSLTETEQSLQAALYKYWVTNKKKKDKVKYALSSVYVFDWRNPKTKKGYRWESDFFFVDKGSFIWEIEIKVDRQDFLNEVRGKSKQKKHAILKEAYDTENSNNFFLPNFFYYMAPKGMIQIEELPPYAGLMEIDEDKNVSIVYSPGFVHDFVDRDNINATLLKKFYGKGLRDEQEFIKYVTKYIPVIRKIKKEAASWPKEYREQLKELTDVIDEYQRKKRIA